MFGVKGNKVLEQQIKAAEKEAINLLKEKENSPYRIDIFRQILQMKERAACFLLGQLKDMITQFMSQGVSPVSLAVIAEAYQQAIEASASQMQIFAKELAELIHIEDTEDRYSFISERIIDEAEALVKPLRENKEKALTDADRMGFVEIYETWHNMSNKPI